VSAKLSLKDLESAAPFSTRHIGPGEDELAKMLAVIGYGSLEELALAAVPEAIRATEGLTLPPASSEAEAIAELRELAEMNRVTLPMLGLGYHGTHTPPVVLRNVLESPAWYTAYTPYQPEISQGRLEALLNFQTMVADLTGLPTSNASLLDEGTAAAEAMTLCRRQSKAGASAVFVVDADCHPQTIAVVQTRAARQNYLATSLAFWPSTPAPAVRSAISNRSLRRPTAGGPCSRSPPTCWRSPCSRAPVTRESTWPSAPRSASASPSATAAPTPATWPSALDLSGRSPAGSSA
jgi:glycine dehydrogenase